MRDLPEIPDGADHLWRWYLELDGKRQAGFSVCALAWSDIKAYFDLMHITPQRWEVDAISRLDDAFLRSRLEKATGKAKGARALKNSMSGKAAR